MGMPRLASSACRPKLWWPGGNKEELGSKAGAQVGEKRGKKETVWVPAEIGAGRCPVHRAAKSSQTRTTAQRFQRWPSRTKVLGTNRAHGHATGRLQG
jgi:hypothetical protein